MKKAVPKGDKRRKKEVTAETTRLEQELQERQEEDLKSVGTTNGVASGTTKEERLLGEGSIGGGGGRWREDEEGWKTVSDEDKPIKKSRAQRRKVDVLSMIIPSLILFICI